MAVSDASDSGFEGIFNTLVIRDGHDEIKNAANGWRKLT